MNVRIVAYIIVLILGVINLAISIVSYIRIRKRNKELDKVLFTTFDNCEQEGE